ncbi:hypothetical protein N7468_003290, partial [Penicillium chermesinum]
QSPSTTPVEKKVKSDKSTATPAPEPASKQVAPQVDDLLDLERFGGEIETNDGQKTSLRSLLEESNAGVVIFTYPRASTPGCTKQACLFRDNHKLLTSTGLAIYGLSADSPKANTTFLTKQNLPYPLLCDPAFTLIGAIGFKKAPKGTTRGVFAVDKKGKVLLREAGGARRDSGCCSEPRGQNNRARGCQGRGQIA